MDAFNLMHSLLIIFKNTSYENCYYLYIYNYLLSDSWL